MGELYISHINIRSLLAGFPDFKNTLITQNYDICLLTDNETWLNENVDLQMFDVPNIIH